MDVSMGYSSDEDVEIDGKTRELSPRTAEEEVDVVLVSSGSSSSSSSSVRDRRMDDDEFKKKIEFWPLQHPMEPPSEDQPVKCPITHHNYFYSTPPPPPHITMPKEEEEEATKEYYLSDDDDTEEMKKKKLINGEMIEHEAGEPHHSAARPLRKRHHAHSILSTHS